MYVFQLPFEQVKLLSGVLDIGNDWERLAGLMGFSSEDVYAFRQAPARGASPTAEILRSWGSRGYKVEQLFQLLTAIQQRRAMQVLLPFVDKKYKAACDKTLDDKKESVVSGVSNGQCDRIPVLPASNTPLRDIPSPSPRKLNEEPPVVPSSSKNDSNLSGSSDRDLAIAAGLYSTLSIPYTELAEATGQFSPGNILGRGGYGVVFKGSWKHTPIAVKLIGSRHNRRGAGPTNSNAEKERLRQSLIELKTLSLYRHDNILPLYAYSLDGPEPCLVYQFMANGSLEDRLLCRTGTAPLGWKQRHTIVVDASRGLNFLHTCARESLIHGDIKSANILLDSHYGAKIGDFGLSRRGVVEIPNQTPPLIASHIKGTLAYLPPEFLRSKHFSTKLDVYSFGVVLFEIATGLRAYSDTRTPENLVDFIRSQISDKEVDGLEETLQRFADCKADVDGASSLVPQCIQMGLKCTSFDPSSRPSVKEVLEIFDV